MKDQQTNNTESQEVMNNNSLGQDTVQTENSNVSQADSPEVAATELQPLSTEKFQALLVANTAKQSKLRLDYAQRLADLQDKYNDHLDAILAAEHQATDELHDARMVYEVAKEQYEVELRSLRKRRSEAGRKYNVGKAEAKNFWTAENEKIQSERHNIFERYRNSGGTPERGRRTPASRLEQRQGRRNER